MQQTYTFHVHGMHCQSCIVLTESTLSEIPEITNVKANLAERQVTVTGDFGDADPQRIAERLTVVLKPHGYTLSLEKEERVVKWSDFTYALPIAAGFIGLFILLQKVGLVNFVTSNDVSYSTAFVIGLIASISTCMAVVGGLVLAMSANFSKEGDKRRPQVLFHVGRLVAFFFLGGVVGAIGASFQLGGTGTFVLSLIVAVVMLLLGINLLDVFPWAKKFQPTMPKMLGKKVHQLKTVNHTLTPLLVGVATFFLPCGFTQSMQFYTLTTGSFTNGALTMGFFALGTLPALGLLSFSSSSIHTKAQSGIFYKTAGLVVIFFGLLNLASSLVIVGVLPPFLNF